MEYFPYIHGEESAFRYIPNVLSKNTVKLVRAQLEAMTLYAHQGFLPIGPRFIEADITHQRMAQTL